MILYGIATREEHNDFLLQMLLEESEQSQEALFGRTDDISLSQRCDSACLRFFVDVN